MQRERRKLLAEVAMGAIIALPPYGDEFLAIAAESAILGGKSTMEDTTTDYREPRRRGAAPTGANLWVGVIVIGSILILAITAGGMRNLVQH
jgi:hypothetical protein